MAKMMETMLRTYIHDREWTCILRHQQHADNTLKTLNPHVLAAVSKKLA